MPTTNAERPEGPLGRLAADWIDNDVNTASLGPVAHLRAPVCGVRVDGCMSASAQGGLALFLARCRGNNARAQGYSNLYCSEPHGTRRAEHQNRFTGAQVGGLHQRVIRAAIAASKHRGFVERHALGNAQCGRVSHVGALGVFAANTDAGDPVAHREARYARPQRNNDARHLIARNKRQRHLDLMATACNKRIDKRYASRMHLDLQFARARWPAVPCSDFVVFPRPEGTAKNCFHFASGMCSTCFASMLR